VELDKVILEIVVWQEVVF